MARQEATNIFSDGLMSDLHPINTPKSVLTDCLNGTYVTYNGNEFILQNDMGNYKLQNCKLPVNFIPVGVKGYADILYIVSYNPITKQVEIGSYPAPQRIFKTNEETVPNVVLTPFDVNGDNYYPEIIKIQKKPLYIFVNSDEEKSKLYPGDEFRLTEDDYTNLNYIYQHLNYYVIDEDKKLYDIEDVDLKNAPKDENNFSKVFWETPGWLAAQWDLFVPDRFNLNLRSLNVPEFLTIPTEENEISILDNTVDDLREWEADAYYFKVSMDLSSQTIITDPLFQEILNNNYNKDSQTFHHLFVRYLVKNGNDYGIFKGMQYSISLKEHKIIEAEKGQDIILDGVSWKCFDVPCYKHNYQDDILTTYNNIYLAWQYPFPAVTADGYDVTNYKGKVEIQAYPVLKMDDGGPTISFTQFATSQKFDLNNLKNDSDIEIANSTYKWSVDDDSCTISFNINGPFINASNITGRYEIYRLNMFEWTDGKPQYTPKTSKSKWGTPTNITIKTKKFGYLKDITNTDVKQRKFTALTQDELIENNGKAYLCMNENIPGNLLMATGDLSNIVLYGQNTINISWTDSNSLRLPNYENWYSQDQKYTILTPSGNTTVSVGGNISIGGSIGTLPGGGLNIGVPSITPIKQEMIKDESVTEKVIDFSKEGGIYVFRVILEQNGDAIGIQDSLLIPSKVFNEFFGSIDNYNNITGDTWINKYSELLELLNYRINNFSVTAKQNVSEYIQYNKKVLDTNWWDGVNSNDEIVNKICTLLYKYPNPYGSQSSVQDNIYIDFNKALDFQFDSDFSIYRLQGNLWNPIISNEFQFLDNNKTNIGVQTDTNVTFNALSYTVQLPYLSNRETIYTPRVQSIYDGTISNATKSAWLGFEISVPQTYLHQGYNCIGVVLDYNRSKNISKPAFFSTSKNGGVTNSVLLNDEFFGGWSSIVPYTTNRFYSPTVTDMLGFKAGAFHWSARLVKGTPDGTILETIHKHDYGDTSGFQAFRKQIQENYIFIPAGVRNSSSEYAGIVLLNLHSKRAAETMRRLLLSLEIKTYINQGDKYVYTIEQSPSWLEKYVISIQSVKYSSLIKSLRVDDYWLNNQNWNNMQNIFTTQLLSNSNIIWQTKSKSIYIDPYIIEVDLTTLPEYKKFYSHFDTSVQQYNKNSNQLINIVPETSVSISEERYNSFSDEREDSLDDFNSLNTSELNELTKRIVGRFGEQLTRENATWKNDPNSILMGNGCRQNEGEIGSGRIAFAYYDEFTLTV